jgi:hypothetical protein
MIVVLSLLLLIPARAQTPRMLDAADLADSASRSAHAVRFIHGETRNDMATVGTLSLPVAGVVLHPGGSVVARMKNTGPGPTHLLVTLATAPSDYGKRQVYPVRVGGNEIYRAAEVDPGGGVNRSFFLPMPSRKPFTEFELLCDSSTEAPITITTLRVYSRLFASSALLPSSLLRVGLTLLTDTVYGYAMTSKKMREIAKRIPSTPYLEPQLAVLFNFCKRSVAENKAEIERLAGLAEETGLPLRIGFQVHWGGTPVGVPDGVGGFWSDPQYQMITFDQDNRVEGPGLRDLLGERYDIRYGLSVPNMWSDTPWLTFNHPRLNEFRRVQLQEAVRAWQTAREQLEAAGKANLLPPELSTGEETVYWAKGVDDRNYTKINGGVQRSNMMADFNPVVVAEALHDGVKLDPRDGLDKSERWWLHQNLARQQQRITDWLFDALPIDPVRMDRRGRFFANDMIRHNIYTEPYAMPLFPMLDVTSLHPGLEAGYVHNGRSGGEYWSGATILPWLQKERERGRIAVPNIECTVVNDPQLVACLRAAYAFGSRFITLYNWDYQRTIAPLLRAFADSIEEAPRLEWGPGLLLNQSKGQSEAVLSREYVAPPDAFGINCVELFVTGKGPLPVSVTLREADTTVAREVCVTAVLTPSTSRSLQRVAIILPTFFLQKPGRRYTLSVAARTEGRARLALSPDGNIAARLSSDLRRERARSLVIEEWQDAADLLQSVRDFHAHTTQSSYATEALKGAEKLFAELQPRESYRAAIRAEQLSLPAMFDVPSLGARLAPYPISVVCSRGGVRATITSCSEGKAIVSIRSAVAQTVTLKSKTSSATAALSPNVEQQVVIDGVK